MPLCLLRSVPVLSWRAELSYPMYRYCDRLRELFHSTLQHELYQRHLGGDELASFYQHADGLMVSAPFQPQQPQADSDGSAKKRSWIALSDEIKCRQGEGLPLPEGVDEQMAGRINRLGEFLFHSLIKAGEHDTEAREDEVNAMLNDRQSVYNENARLGIGRFIQSGLLPVFQQASSASASSPRFHLFAAHDSSVIALLSALQMDAAMGGHWPPFASWIVMEVLRDEQSSEQRYVRVVYNGEEAALVSEEEWMRRMQNVCIDEYEFACKAHSDKEVPPQSW